MAPSPAAAQLKLSPTLDGQFATTGGLIINTDSPEWYVGQDVYITYQVSNLTSDTIQNVTFTYAISGLVPYEYNMALSGDVSGPIFGAGRVYVTYMAPGSSINFFVKTHVGVRGTNYFQVFYNIPVSTGGSGRTEGNLYFACYGREGTPNFSDLAIGLLGPPEGIPYGEKTTATLLVRNEGITTATGITANFVIPAGDFLAKIDAVETTTGLTQLHNENQMTISWIIDELGPGKYLEMIITVHPTTFNSFQVEAVCASSGVDIAPENNSLKTIVPVTGIDRQFELEAGITASTTQTHWGGFVAYMISVTNHGPDEATAITVHTPGKDHHLAYKIFSENWAPGTEPQTISYLRRLPPGHTAVYAWLDMIQPGEVGNTAPNAKTVSCTVKTPWAEGDMANNTASVNLNFASQPSPAVADLSLTPASIPVNGFQSQALAFTYMLRNNGPSPVADAYAGFYLPGRGAITGIQCERGSSLVSEKFAQLSGVNIAPGEQIPLTFNVLPDSGGLMSFYAGTASGVYDAQLGNDYHAGSLPIFVIAGDDLDLAADLQASAQATYMGGRWQINITGNLIVSNGGGFSVPAQSIPVRFYLSSDETVGGTDTLTQSAVIPATWSGSSYTLPVDISFLSAAKSLNKYLIAVIDPDGAIEEVSEENNAAAVYLP